MAKRNYCYVDFTRAPEVPLFAAATGAVRTAANAQVDQFFVNGHYFELTQGVGGAGANTALATTGLTPGATGYLLPGDNAAGDGVEITRGIVSGSAQSFTAGTDPAFFVRATFKIPTRANLAGLAVGFRKLAAYETAQTAAEMLAAYDDKVWVGIKGNAGVRALQTSKAAADVETTPLTLGACANNDIQAMEVRISAAGVPSVLLGAATPAGASYAQTQAGIAAAIAALAADTAASAALATLATVTAGEYVPAIVYCMAGGAAISDLRLCTFECGYL